MVPKNLKIAPGWDKLADLEPTAKAEYFRGLDSGAADPRSANLDKQMTALAVEFPQLGREQRWEELKKKFPQVLWGYVLLFGTESPPTEQTAKPQFRKEDYL